MKVATGRLCELLVAVIETAATDQVNSETPFRIQMNYGVNRGRKYLHVSAWESQIVQREGIDAEPVVIELQQRAQVRREIVADAALDVPAFIQMSSCVACRIRETGAGIERESRRLLRAEYSG
ncbi:MAG TPA: hypothetical protein VEV17_22000 [Bryobacteraceae bacterium]|nr:hypothetical protein [Bryobacteraceae bacterium]